MNIVLFVLVSWTWDVRYSPELHAKVNFPPTKVLADVSESIAGAVYVDSGYSINLIGKWFPLDLLRYTINKAHIKIATLLVRHVFITNFYIQ